AAGDDDGAAYLVDVAWCGIAVCTRRRGAPQAADVAGGIAGSRSADLSARSRFSDGSSPGGAGFGRRRAVWPLGQAEIRFKKIFRRPRHLRSLTKIRDGLAM